MGRTSFLIRFTGALVFLSIALTSAFAQKTAVAGVDLGITFTAQRSLALNTSQNFWAQGGSVELGVSAFHGFGLAANITGVRTSNIGSTGVPLGLVTETFGPRYRWHGDRHLSLYGETLVGEANAFDSLFPAAAGAQSDANSLALRIGAGLDVRLAHHLRVRALDAAWLRTTLPNSTSNIQNNLLLGAGLVLRSGR